MKAGPPDPNITFFQVKRRQHSTGLEFLRSEYQPKEGNLEYFINNRESDVNDALIEQELIYLNWVRLYDLHGEQGIPEVAIKRITRAGLNGNRYFMDQWIVDNKVYYQNGTVLSQEYGTFRLIDFRKRIVRETDSDLNQKILKWKFTDKSEILATLQGDGIRPGDEWEPNRFWLIDLR